MSLKTDYKDALFTGNRKYRIVDNEDGTYSFIDVTDYTQVGDQYGAKDINDPNTAINDLIEDLGGLNFEKVAALPSDAADHPDTVYIVTEE